MSSICASCALHMRQAARAGRLHSVTRTFSTTGTQQVQHRIPTFHESTNPELNDLFSTIRNTNFIPAYIHKEERRRLFKEKYRQILIDNPQTTTVGDEEVALKPMKHSDHGSPPQRLKQAIQFMKEGDPSEWRNLAALLTGMKKTGLPISQRRYAEVVRAALRVGQRGAVLLCLQQSEATGMTLRNKEILHRIVWSMREDAEAADWSEEALSKALRDLKAISGMLEKEEHREIAPKVQDSEEAQEVQDPRTQPGLIGVYLELSATYASRHLDGKDADGTVKMFVDRLVGCIDDGTAATNFKVAKTAEQVDLLQGTAVWHGLGLAQQVLGSDLPSRKEVEKIIAEYDAGLRALAQKLEASNPTEGSYVGKALKTWRACAQA